MVHSEMPEGKETCHLLQLWINLPASYKMMPPRYQNIHSNEMPQHRASGVVARVFSGRLYEAAADTENVVPVLAFIADISPGHDLIVPLDSTWTAFSYVIGGAARFLADGGGQILAHANDMVLFQPRLPEQNPSSSKPISSRRTSPSPPTVSPTGSIFNKGIVKLQGSRTSIEGGEGTGRKWYGSANNLTGDGVDGGKPGQGGNSDDPRAASSEYRTIDSQASFVNDSPIFMSDSPVRVTFSPSHVRGSPAAVNDGGTGNIRIAVDASIKSETRIIFFAGSPLREPVCAEGPFVMNTHAEIVQAHREYLAGLLH